MEADVIKWLWTNLPTLSAALILARLYVVAIRKWEEQERRCQSHSSLMRRMKDVLLSEFPKRTRELLEGKGENDD